MSENRSNRSRNHVVALTYAAAGAPIFPCNQIKKSLVPDWVNAATTSPSQIDLWWSEFPDALVALPMKRVDCLTIDCDRHDAGADGVAMFHAMIAENSPLPEHPRIDTANNGEHHIFRQPSDDKIGNKKFAPGLETRGYKNENDGGYIIVSGTVLPNGRGWKPAAGSPSFLKSLKAGTIPAAPEWLINKLNGQPKPPPPEWNGGGSPSPHGGREEAYAQAALCNIAAELGSVTKGNRNNALNVASLKMGAMIARNWIAKATVADALYEACVRNGLVTDDGADSVQKTLASGFKAGLENPHASLKDRPPDGGGHKQTAKNTKPNGGAVSDEKLINKTLVVTRASDIVPVPVEWLWPGRLAKGKTTLLGGYPGVGKSQLSIFIAATISIGGQWPCGEGTAPKKSVIVLCAEDGLADTIVPRLLAAGGDSAKVEIVSAVTDNTGGDRRIFNLSNDLDLLEAHIKKCGDVGLVIIDPVDAYIGGNVDSHKNAAVRAVLEPISELADRLGVAILAVTHFSKQAGNKAMYRFIGSIAHVGSARVAFAVIADAENEGRTLVLHAKNNLAPAQKGLAYRLEQRTVAEGVVGSYVHFEHEYVVATADEALAAERDSGVRSDAEEAADFLTSLLATGAVKVEIIEQEAIKVGLLGVEQSIGQSKPFRSARKRLGIKPYQPKGEKAPGWEWALPPDTPHQVPSEASDALQKNRASDGVRASDTPHDTAPHQVPPSSDALDCGGDAEGGWVAPQHIPEVEPATGADAINDTTTKPNTRKK